MMMARPSHQFVREVRSKTMAKGEDTDARATRLNLRGVAALNHNDTLSAQKLFAEAYTLDPKNAFTLNNIGYVAELNGDRETAEMYYEAASSAAQASERVTYATRLDAEGRKVGALAGDIKREVDSALKAIREVKRRARRPIGLTRRDETSVPENAPRQQPPLGVKPRRYLRYSFRIGLRLRKAHSLRRPPTPLLCSRNVHPSEDVRLWAQNGFCADFKRCGCGAIQNYAWRSCSFPRKIGFLVSNSHPAFQHPSADMKSLGGQVLVYGCYALPWRNDCLLTAAGAWRLPGPCRLFRLPLPHDDCGGASATLTWISANAASATINSGIGSVALSGSTTVTPTQTTTYTITVSASGTGTATAQATVMVTPLGAPTVTISANPTSIVPGQSSTLTVVAANSNKVVITDNLDSNSYPLPAAGGPRA